jgi:hypothetical protein
VSLKAAVDHPALAAGKEHNLLAMLEIQAPKFEEESRRSRGTPAHESSSNLQAAPIDLVTVIDTSGSMTGAKIKLVRETLLFMLGQLKPEDRLGIVTFSTDVEVKMVECLVFSPDSSHTFPRTSVASTPPTKQLLNSVYLLSKPPPRPTSAEDCFKAWSFCVPDRRRNAMRSAVASSSPTVKLRLAFATARGFYEWPRLLWRASLLLARRLEEEPAGS